MGYVFVRTTTDHSAHRSMMIDHNKGGDTASAELAMRTYKHRASIWVGEKASAQQLSR